MTTRSWRYRILRALPLGLVACFGTLAATTASSAATWSLTQVDNSADVGKFASVAADGNNKLHISYLDSTGTLKYATNKSGSWSAAPVTNSTLVAGKVVLAGTALAIDAQNNPLINYYYNASTGSRGMRNIVNNGTSWAAPSNINGSYAPALNQSTAIYNRGGYSHLTFVKNTATSTLYYTRNSNAGTYTAWNTPVGIDGTDLSGTNSSIVVDSAEVVHVVGYNSSSTDLFYYTNESGSWVKSPLASSSAVVGKWCSLAIDSSDNLHLAYLETTSSPATYRIKYRFKPAGGVWQSAVDIGDAGSLGGYPSVVADSTGRAHISFYYSAGSLSGKLRYATNLSGTWGAEDVDTGSANVGQYSSIALDGEQTVSIAYYDVTNSALKVAYRKALLTSSNAVSFGTVDRGFQSAAASITITNNLPVDQVLGTVAKGGGYADEFGIESDSCSNAQLLPQGTCTVQLRFAPPAGAPRSSQLTATLAVPAAAPYALNLAFSLSGATSANYLLTASASGGGSISPTMIAVAPGGSQSFGISPDVGFSVGSVVADGSTPLTAPYTLSNVNADHTLLATLVSPIRVLESSIFYGSLQSAFATVNPGWTIQSQSTIPTGDLLVDRDVAVTLSGGYDGNFVSQPGFTTVPGNVVISNGSLTVENVVIQ